MPQRKSDRPIRRFIRAVVIALIPTMLGAVGVLWADREEKITLLHKNTSDIAALEARVNHVEERVNESITLTRESKQEIMSELKLIKTVLFKVLTRTETLSEEGDDNGPKKAGRQK